MKNLNENYNSQEDLNAEFQTNLQIIITNQIQTINQKFKIQITKSINLAELTSKLHKERLQWIDFYLIQNKSLKQYSYKITQEKNDPINNFNLLQINKDDSHQDNDIFEATIEESPKEIKVGIQTFLELKLQFAQNKINQIKTSGQDSHPLIKQEETHEKDLRQQIKEIFNLQNQNRSHKEIDNKLETLRKIRLMIQEDIEYHNTKENTLEWILAYSHSLRETAIAIIKSIQNILLPAIIQLIEEIKLRNVNSDTLQEITQETHITMLKIINDSKLYKIQSIKSYTYKIAKNKHIEIIRKQKLNIPLDNIEIPCHDPHIIEQEDELQSILSKIRLKLKNQKDILEIFELVYKNQNQKRYDTKQIANFLGKSPKMIQIKLRKLHTQILEIISPKKERDQSEKQN